MKKIILLCSLLLMTTNISANEELAAKMQEMFSSFKVIGGLMRGGPISDDHVDAAVSLQRSAAQAALIFPDSAIDDSAKLQYLRWMVELINVSIELETEGRLVLSGESSDLANTKAVILKIADLRKSGHGLFKTR